ncbi:MAG: hypothetical protein ABR925_04015 [Acidimicrobiales bacterium]
MPSDSRGIYRIVAAAVVIGDEDAAHQAASEVVSAPGHTRPFHRYRGGIKARHSVTECLSPVGAVAHVRVRYPTARRRPRRPMSGNWNCWCLDSYTTRWTTSHRSSTRVQR